MMQPVPTEPRAAWHLVYTKPRQERAALEHLERQGYAAYLPLLATTRRVGQRNVNRVAAMFPRYLFVRLAAEKDNFAPIRSTVGVVGLVRFGERYAVLPDELVTTLAARSNENGVIEQAEPDFAPGDGVLILDGALKGYEAVFSATVGKERIALLLQIADRQLTIETSRFRVERVR